MRASISTCRIGMSICRMILRTSSSRAAVSCTNRMLVRGSTIATPRFERIEPWPPVVAVCPAPAPNCCCRLVVIRFCEVLRLDVVQLERLGDAAARARRSAAALSSCCFSLSASSSRGAISTTLPFLRMSRPLVCRMMSSAWSQGTSFRRSVRLPLHRVAGDDVEAGEVGDDLQHRAHFDVLEVERQLLALVAAARALRRACSGPPGPASPRG